MDNLVTIISVSCTALGFLATAITFIVRFVKSIKDKKVALREKRLAQDTLKICEALGNFVAQAEKFLGFGPAEKKEFAKVKANQFAIENGIAFNEAFVDGKIEELVKLSKEVNVRDKDKPQLQTMW